jgi:WD40 repeat protein
LNAFRLLWSLSVWLLAGIAFAEPPRTDAFGDPLPAGTRYRLGTLRLLHPGGARTVAFSPDGKTLASGSRGYDLQTSRRWGEVKLWDTATGKQRQSFRHEGDSIDCLTFSPDGRMLAVGSDRSVWLWAVDSGKKVGSFEQLADGIRCVAFSPDGRTLAAAGPRRVWLWDVAGQKEVRSFRRRVEGFNPTFSSDLKTLASPCHQDLDLWDLATGKERLYLPDHRGQVIQASFSADGQTVAVGYYRVERRGKSVGEVKVWDAIAGKERATLKGHTGVLRGVLLSPDGKTLALLGTEDLWEINDVKLLDWATGRLISALTFATYKESPECMAFSPDGKIFAVGCEDGTVRLWDILPPKKK